MTMEIFFFNFRDAIEISMKTVWNLSSRSWSRISGYAIDANDKAATIKN